MCYVLSSWPALMPFQRLKICPALLLLFLATLSPTPLRCSSRPFFPLQLIMLSPFLQPSSLARRYLSWCHFQQTSSSPWNTITHQPFPADGLRFLLHASAHLAWTPFAYRINYYLCGGFHPVSFHVINILLHGGISVLMVDVFSVLFGGLQYTRKGRRLNLAPRSSLLAALLFAVHPVHTECVSNVRPSVRGVCLCVRTRSPSYVGSFPKIQGFPWIVLPR